MKRIMFFLLMVLIVPSVCLAESSEWKDQQFNFSTIKTILYGPPTAESDVQDRFARQKAADYLQAAFNEKESTIRFIRLQNVIEMIGRDNGVDMEIVRKSDFVRYKKLFIENASKYCDAIMTANVLVMGYGKIRREASVSAWTATQTNNYMINGGLYSITGPTTQFRIDPAHDVTIVNGGIFMSLISTNTGNTIWGITDVRDRTNKKLNSTNPDEMLKRIINTSVDKMLNVIIKKE